VTLAYIGNVEVVTNFMRLLTNNFKGKEITLEEETTYLETIEALGLLASRYEAAYDFLKKGVTHAFWQTNTFFSSPGGYELPGQLIAASIRGLGYSGRPEALGF